MRTHTGWPSAEMRQWTSGGQSAAQSAPYIAIPLRVRIREHITARIVDGTYVPGQRLTEAEVARTLGTSQTPVREALRELSAMGFLESAPNKGCRVRRIDSEEIRQAHIIRAALEDIAGQLAAPQLKGNTTQLRTSLGGMRAALLDGDLAALCFHSTQFHRSIVDSANNTALTRAWNAVGIEMLTLIGAGQPGVDLYACVEEHDAIMNALDAGNASTAGRLLKNHACAYIADQPDRVEASHRIPSAR